MSNGAFKKVLIFVTLFVTNRGIQLIQMSRDEHRAFKKVLIFRYIFRHQQGGLTDLLDV